MSHTPDAQTATILIVDDLPNNLAILSDYLQMAGFGVLAAEDGERGLAIAQRELPDLILLDVLMPGLDGFETCRRLKAAELTNAIPVIFLTSLTDTADKVAGFAAGGVDYVTKPFQMEDVLMRVRTHLSLQIIQKQLEAKNVQLHREIAERQRAEAALQCAHDELEGHIAERTTALATANAHLRAEITERQRAEAKIQRRNRELDLLNRIIAASIIETEREAILEITCRELALAFDVPRAAATLLNQKKTEATVIAEYLAEGRSVRLRRSYPYGGEPGVPVFAGSQKAAGYRRCPKRPTDRSLP